MVSKKEAIVKALDALRRMKFAEAHEEEIKDWVKRRFRLSVTAQDIGRVHQDWIRQFAKVLKFPGAAAK